MRGGSPLTTQDSFIVCGWYTPDYGHWVHPLRLRLDALGVSHDFVEVERRPGGWEANTLMKPGQIRVAMGRNPGKTILFLDVDCRIVGMAQDLCRVADISGDLGFYVRTRIRTNRQPLFAPRSGTLVLKPTDATQAFVDAWIKLSAEAPRFVVDQTTFTLALGHVPGLTITVLPVEACSTPGDRTPGSVILHDRASVDAKRAGRLAKLTGRLWG